MTRRFNKFGLRRDLNFADLANPQQSLDNILGGLVDVGGESFISQDLDAIRDIGATTITNDDFRSIVGAAVKVTDTVTGNLVVYKPVVKFKNRLDVGRFTVGEPNFYGGDGLTARYYENDQINSTAADSDDIFTGIETEKEIFWERGIFDFVTKINDQFDDIYGGVVWEGYFRPTSSGKWLFDVETSGFYTIEFDDGLGNLVLIGRKSQKNTNIIVNAATAGDEWLTLTTTADIKNVLLNDVVIHPTIAQFADTESANYSEAITITQIDYETGLVRLSSPLDENLAGGTTLTFRHRIGETAGRIRYLSQNLEQYNTYRIRYRFWYPDIAGLPTNSQKNIIFRIVPPNDVLRYLDYKWLYSEDYNINPAAGTSEVGDFRNFYNLKLDASGGTIGSNTYATYEGVITKAPLSVSYSPPVSLASAIGQTKTVNLLINTNSLSTALTDGIVVGQYVFGEGIPLGTRVKSISINSGIFLTQNVTATASGVSVTFVDHRGIVTFQTSASTTSGNKSITVSADTWNAVSQGDVIVAANLPQYTIITRKAASNVLVLSDAPTSTTTTALYFYRSVGILNNTLSVFCNDVVSAPTVAQSNAGATTLTVAYVDGIGVNDRPQFGSRIAAGTTVTAVNTTTKVVTLSAALLDDIPTGQLVTFAPAGTTDNKELCFPPIDTSPPFTATAFGLTTTSTRPTINIAPIGGAFGELKFVGLSADGVPTPASISPTVNYTRTLRIRDATGAEFRILATT